MENARDEGKGRCNDYLGGEDLKVDPSEALEVLLEEALGIVLTDLLASHGRSLEPC